MNKKSFLSILTALTIIGTTIPTIGLVSCGGKKIDDKPDDNTNNSNPGVLNGPKELKKTQMQSVYDDLNYFFHLVPTLITPDNVNQVLESDKAVLRKILNDVLRPTKLAIYNEDNFLHLFNNEVTFNDDGYQVIDVGIRLNTILLPNIEEGSTNAIKVEKINKNQIYLVTSVTTSYKPSVINSGQLIKIQKLFETNFKPIDVEITPDNINQVVGEDKLTQFKDAINAILVNNNITVDDNDPNFLSLWNPDDYRYDNGYQIISVAVPMNTHDKNIEFGADNYSKIQLQTSDDINYLVCDITTNFKKYIDVEPHVLNTIQKWLNELFNEKIDDKNVVAENKEIAVREITRILEKYNLQVKDVLIKKVSDDPVSFELTIHFDCEINLLESENSNFKQTDEHTLKYKKRLITGIKPFPTNDKQFTNQYVDKSWTDFQATKFIGNPWAKVDWSYPDNVIFDSVFDGFNNDVLKNDVLYLLKSLISNASRTLKFYINNLDINYDSKNKICSVNLDFNIYNSGDEPITLKVSVPNNDVKKVVIPADEIMHSSLIINQAWNKAFDFQPNKVQQNININYYFNNIDWLFGTEDFYYPKFYFGKYSNGFKRRILNVNVSKGYFDIAQTGNQYLSNLTLNDIQIDIKNKFDLFNKKFLEFSSALQKILKSLTLNETTNKSFLVNNAHNFGVVIDGILSHFQPGLVGIAPVIEKVFNGSTLGEILGDKQTRNYLSRVFKDNPTISNIIDLFYKFVLPNNGTTLGFVYDLFVKCLCGESTLIPIPLPDKWKNFFKDQTIKNLLKNDFKKKPFVDILIMNASDILKNVNRYIYDGKSVFWETIYYFALAVSWRGLNGSVLDTITAMVKDRKTFVNNKTMYLIESLLNCFYVNINVIDYVKKLFLDNPSYNKETIRTFFKVLSGMSPNGNLNEGYDFGDYFLNNVVKGIQINGTYNQSSHAIDLTIRMNYVLNKDIVFNYQDFFSGWIPSGVQEILSWFPRNIVFPKGSQFVKTVHLKNKLDYTVIKDEKGNNVLTWQANDADVNYNFDFDSTLSKFYNQANTKFKWFIIEFLKVLLYGQENTSERYVADAIGLREKNQTVQNYSNYAPQNNCVIVKNVSPEYMQVLKQSIFKNIKLERIPNVSSQLDNTYIIHKLKSVNDFQYYPTINDLFDLSNVTADNNDFQYVLDSNILSQITMFDKSFTIGIAKLQLRFKSPMCFFDEKTQKYYWKDNWSFSFFDVNLKL